MSQQVAILEQGVPLESLVEIWDKKRKPINAKERAKRTGDVPYYGATGQVGWIDEALFDDELVLLGEDGAPFLDRAKDVAYVINGPAWVNNHAHVLKPNEGVPASFLRHALNWIDYRPLVGGTTRLKLTQADMKLIRIPEGPAAKASQVADYLDTQFSRIADAEASLKRAKANLERYRRSVLHAACTGRLVPTEAELARAEGRDYEPADQLLERILIERRAKWEEAEIEKAKAKGKELKGDAWKKRYKQPVAPEMDGLSDLPEGWCWATVDQISFRTQYGYTASSTSEQVGPRFLRITDIQDNQVAWDSVPFCEASDEDAIKFQVSPGDIFVARTGATVGKSFLVREAPPAVFASYLIRIAAGDLGPYLWQFMQSIRYWKFITSNSRGIGQPNVNAKVLSSLPIPLPPQEEYRRIVEACESNQEHVARKNSELVFAESKLSVLRQSILQSVFGS